MKPAEGQRLSSVAVGKQSEVADLDETGGQHMEQEAADELKLPPKSCAPNACGIVRHSTLWVKPQVVAEVKFLEWSVLQKYTDEGVNMT